MELKALIFVLIIVNVMSQVHGYQVKHPQALDLGSIDINVDDILKVSSGKNSLDCSTFYRRIVKYLFDKKRFKDDPESGYFIASISLRLNKEQFDLLVDNDINGLNINEVDNLLADVVKQSNDENWQYPVSQILFEHYKQQLIMSMPSLNSPGVIIAVAILVIVITSRFFNFSKLTFSAIILLVFLCICSVSYGMNYYDCLSDLEVEQMIQLSKQQSTNNPCKDYHGEHASFWSSMNAAVFGSSENKCLDHMRKTFKTSKKYCDPLDVFAKWFGKIQMSYFTSVIGGFMEVISNISSSSNFITKIVFWVIGAGVFVYIFMAFGKVVIKSTFHGAFDALKTTKVAPEPNQDSAQELRQLSSKIDTILTENKEMKRELIFIRECSVEKSRASPPRIEGKKRLQDITEDDNFK